MMLIKPQGDMIALDIFDMRVMAKRHLFYSSCGLAMTIFLLMIHYLEHIEKRIISNEGVKSPSVVDISQIVSEVKVTAVNCSELANGVLGAQQLAKSYQNDIKEVSKRTLRATKLEDLASNCTTYLRQRPYITKSLSEEEKDFPIAYSLLMYTDPGQAERLLRAIYQPQNYYCLHVDRSSPMNVHRAMSAVASCLPNVFIARRTVDVVWGHYSILKAELACMEDLFKRPGWKYFINLTGQEYPLKTNLELVRILRVYNGSNDVAGISWDR